MTYLVSALTSVCVTLFLFLFQPWLKKWWTTKRIEMSLSFLQGDHINVRVINHSSFTVGQAAVYITVEHELKDLLDPPKDMSVRVFHPPSSAAPISECLICWSSRSPKEITPAKIDIFSMETQVFSPFRIDYDRGHIEIPSEVGWDDKKDLVDSRCYRTSRAMLRIKKYCGKLKIVSADTFGKSYRFELDPSNREYPLKLFKYE